jgi:hypothetical protein
MTQPESNDAPKKRARSDKSIAHSAVDLMAAAIADGAEPKNAAREVGKLLTLLQKKAG